MALRTTHLHQLAQDRYDVLIVGGGINGAVSAAALAARGVRVALIDRGDFAGFTSAQSSNLIWGGIKYLESCDFRLVRKLCLSRNRLLQSYPASIREIRFLAAIPRGFRYPPGFLWLGAWLYWLLGNGFTAPPRLMPRGRLEQEEPIIDSGHCSGGFEYSDAYLPDSDARFVFGFVRAALDHGAVAANYVESLGGRRETGRWVIRARDVITGREFNIAAKALINAAGPFVDEHNQLTGQQTEHRHVFSKGIHLIVDRLTPHSRVLAFFADDGRPFFAIPLAERTCIGTTDTPAASPYTVVTDEDRRFVLDNINNRLRLSSPLTRRDIIAERCGVRPLAVRRDAGETGDWLHLSRRHVIEVNPHDAHLSIFGGKLTDCLNVGDEVCAQIQRLGVAQPNLEQSWYGEPPAAERERFLRQAREMELDRLTEPEAAEPLASRLWRRYGTTAFDLLAAIRRAPHEAEVLLGGCIRCEIRLLQEREMIVKLEDFLRRRTTIAQTTRPEQISSASGLMATCRILFGDEAQAKWLEYCRENSLETSSRQD